MIDMQSYFLLDDAARHRNTGMQRSFQCLPFVLSLSKHIFKSNQQFIEVALRQAQGERLFIEAPLSIQFFIKSLWTSCIFVLFNRLSAKNAAYPLKPSKTAP